MAMATEDFRTHHHDGSSLIVGFPTVPRQRGGPRRHSGDLDDSTSTVQVFHVPLVQVTKEAITRPKVRSVSFSESNKMILIPTKSKQERASAWYSKEDKNHFKRMVLRNAAEVSRRIETGSSLTVEDLCDTVGMEGFMSKRLMWLSMVEKQRHSQSVVSVQATLDPSQLSRFSKRSSLRSRRRAYERAVLNQFST